MYPNKLNSVDWPLLLLLEILNPKSDHEGDKRDQNKVEKTGKQKKRQKTES